MFHVIRCETENAHHYLLEHLSSSQAKVFFQVYDAPQKHSVFHTNVLPTIEIPGAKVES